MKKEDIHTGELYLLDDTVVRIVNPYGIGYWKVNTVFSKNDWVQGELRVRSHDIIQRATPDVIREWLRDNAENVIISNWMPGGISSLLASWVQFDDEHIIPILDPYTAAARASCGQVKNTTPSRSGHNDDQTKEAG